MIHLPDISEPVNFLIASGILFVIIIGRYLLVAGIFYLVFHTWFPDKWQQRKLSTRRYKSGQLRREIGWSVITSILFSLAGVLTLILWQNGDTNVYTEINTYGWWYLPLSLLLSFFIHETYYYWVHRLMHHPAIFRSVHKVHHDSNTTSPFTAFSFHPLEGLLQAIVLPFTLIIIPLHPIVILFNLMVMTFSSVINHLNIEIYPSGFNKHFVGKWLIGATHHSLHHKHFKFNFGLYFTFWDRIGKTESPSFVKLFETVTSISNDHTKKIIEAPDNGEITEEQHNQR